MTWTPTTQALNDADFEVSQQTSGHFVKADILTLAQASVATGTAHTIIQGATYTQAAADTFILFDTSAGAQATATLNMIAGSYVGQEITLKWFGWGTSNTAPTINAEPGTELMEPFTGMAASGTAGLTATGNLDTPGASYTLRWSGTYWLKK